MAHQPPQNTKTKVDDALSLESQAVAPVNTQRSRATVKPLGLNPFLPPHSPIKLPMRGTHHKSEVEMPRQNAQQGAGQLVQAGLPNKFAEDAKAQDTSSSDDLSDPEDIESDFRMSPEVEEPVDRLEKYAFNYAGQAYDHRVPQHLARGTSLFANKLQQNRTISQHLEWAEKQADYNACPGLIPRTVERERGSKTIECVWVGMLPNSRADHQNAASNPVQPQPQAGGRSSAGLYSEPDPLEGQLDGASKASKKAPRTAKKSLPIVDLEDDQLDVIPYSPYALRVVAKISTNPAVKGWFLYAMTSPEGGSILCQGWRVNLEEVFFFKTFRDDTAAGYMKRRHATDAKIKAVIFRAIVAPALVPQSPTSVARSTTRGSVPLSPTPDSGSLPTPKSFGKKELAARILAELKSKKAPNTGGVPNAPNHEGGDTARVKPIDSVQDGNTPISEEGIVTRSDPKTFDTDNVEKDLPEPTGIVLKDDDEDDDAYPEYAFPPTNRAYTDFVDNMMRELSVVEPTDIKAAEKRKRVTFEPSEEHVANKRRKTGGSPSNNENVRGSENRAGSASFVAKQDTEHLVNKLGSLISKLAMSQDIAGLDQCVTMMECIEKRGRPGPTSALSPYLSVSSSKDTDIRACCSKLQEILDLFPNLENADIDNHLLSWMICGLRVTGQSIDITLIEPCVISFSRLYKKKFGKTANHQKDIEDSVLIDMICQARDDAEKVVKKNPFPSDPKVWAPHFWIDPRQDVQTVKVDQVVRGRSKKS
ncbi:hypothetical protein Daus18300_003862 [Diaporthe australafricana]|uniref:Uncharacterized protein n=1 Tax=Diaporthe australafricana TaxID=127596 RepID=A0ABR3XD01_9PEZI